MTTNMISKSMFEQKSYYEFRDLRNPVSNEGMPFHPYYSDTPIITIADIKNIIVATTYLTVAAQPGETMVYVNSSTGFKTGMTMDVGSGLRVDTATITGFGITTTIGFDSIMFNTPLVYGYPIGTNVNGLVKSNVNGLLDSYTIVPDLSNTLSVITNEDLAALQTIELNYGQPMANKNYEAIPNDYNKYIELYALIYGILQNTKDPKLMVLLQITNEALQGAINAYTIYGDNLAFKLSNLNLQKQIDDILSNKNEHVVATASGQLSVTKKFTLAPVFNYYIVLYGMPVFGVGFDPLKINFLAGLLTRIGINPYK